jgi:hypothetical protein
MELYHFSETAVNSENPQDVINSNIWINLSEEKIDDDLIHEDALMSYYLDYYTLNIPKVIAQFVYNPLERGIKMS